MEPANTIISKLGGVEVVKSITGVHRTRVSNWKRPKESGGTGGTIPAKHIPKLLNAARERGIELDLADFFEGVGQ
jgi:hypothetical protein